MATSDSDRVSRSSAVPEMVLAGYLYKKTRDGRMQKRYFETNGFYLTYYKNRKAEKLLAALSLPQVGNIHLVDDENGEEGMFALELNTRVYTLKANDRKTAQVWVDTLKGLREQGKQNLQKHEISTGTAPEIINSGTGPGTGTPKNKEVDQWVKPKNTCCGCF